MQSIALLHEVWDYILRTVPLSDCNPLLVIQLLLRVIRHRVQSKRCVMRHLMIVEAM